MRTKNLQGRDLRSEDEHRAGDEQDVLEYARKREDKAAAGAHKEHRGDVEQERDHRVREQDERPGFQKAPRVQRASRQQSV